jgi:hypothetical protein
MEDINKELDLMAAEDYITDTFIYAREIAPEAYTLTDDDYAMSSNADVAKYKNFSASALPKDYLPEILNQKFTAANAAELLVTFNYYSKPVADKEAAYVIDTAEYMEMGQTYPNFTDKAVAENLIGKLLDRKVYAAEAGMEMTAMYILYATNMERFILVNADKSTEVLSFSNDAYELDTNDYADLGNGKYDNFDHINQAQEKVVTLAELKNHDLPKEYSCMVYKNYLETYVVYIFDGSNWVVKQSLMPTTEPLNYALDKTDITKSYWWADPALKITLGTDDYNMYPETGRYQNFDTRSTDDAKLIEMIGAMLDANHNAVDDQQYLVTYAYYDGGNGIKTVRLIRTAGVWSEFSK